MVAVGNAPGETDAAVSVYRPGRRVHVDHYLDPVRGTGFPGLDVDDGPGIALPGNQVRLAPRVALLPFRVKEFWFSVKTVNPKPSHSRRVSSIAAV